MKNPLEYKGYWWLPGADDNKLPGTLSYSQTNGAILEIVGVFGTERSARVEQPTIILGVTQQGTPITLYKCTYKKWTHPLTGLGGGTYHAHFVFEGVHFDTEEKITFHQLCGNFTDLDAWVNIYGFTIESNVTDGKVVHKILYEKPASQTFDIDDAFEAGIGFSSYGPEQSIVQTNVEISQRAYFVINSKNGDIDFESMFAKLNIFSCLLQVAVQRIPYPVAVFGYSRENAQEREGKEPYYPKINIYYQPVEAIADQRPKLPHEMLFTYKDLDADQITTWFNSFPKYQTVIHLYRTLFYSNRLFIENRFLNIAQALESLHNILFVNHYLPGDEFRRRRDEVLQSVPEEYREWVRAALKNANFKRFRLKIYELLDAKAYISKELVDDYDVFAKRVMQTRNEFVHQSKQKLTFRGRELLSAIDILTMLFEAYILEIIGFSDDKIRELLNAKIQTHLTGWKTLRLKK